MRYIGGKSQLLEEIGNTIQNLAPEATSIIDVFSGSGVVANYFKAHNYSVICNDQLYFSYVLLRGITQLNAQPTFTNLGIEHPIEYLNQLTLQDTNFSLANCFIYQNYSPHDTCNRMYFSTENALKIDIIRLTIEDWFKTSRINEDEYYYLLAALISAVPYVSNIAGVYCAYLKHWDPRAVKPMHLSAPTISFASHHSITVQAYNQPCNPLLQQSNVHADVLYADSPYNSREYLPNYHILETIARYDYPLLHGVTGMRNYENQKSDFCKKSRVAEAFNQLIQNAQVSYVVISYNSEGLLSTEDLTKLCQQYAVTGTFSLKEIPYRKYKSKQQSAFTRPLCEQIYAFKKNSDF